MTLQPGLPENIPDREEVSVPYTFLIDFYQKTLSLQLQQELRVNQAALPHEGLDRHEKKLLRLRNLKIDQAKTALAESIDSPVPEFAILKASAIMNHCPVPQTHDFINGETTLTFTAEPDLISLTNLLKTVEPLATHKDANPQFVKYFANLKQKYSQVLLDESLNNGERRGLVGIKVKGGLRVTGIARDYLTPEGYHPKAIDQKKKALQEVFTQDIKKFIRKHKDFGKGITPPVIAGSKQDLFPEMTKLEEKVTHKDYILGADEIDKFITLTKSQVYFKPDQQLRQIQKLVNETRTLEFDTIRTKKVQQKLNIVATFANLLAMGGGSLNHTQSADALSHALQPDGDPMRQLHAMGSVVDLGHYFYDHRSEDPINTAVTYLEDPDHVRPVASYLLCDYFESLQHFPVADRPRLVEKATTFVNEVATRYNLPDDPNHDSLAEYLMASSEDPEMQDLLGYTVLPLIAYAAENEDSFAREQWLDNASQILANNHDDTLAKYAGDLSENKIVQGLADKYLLPTAEHLDSTERDNLMYWASMHFVNGDYEKLMPYLDKAFALIANYDPDNVKIDFDNPDSMRANGGLITVPHSITEALNALPPNPNYLAPEKFLYATQESYLRIWKEIYGPDSIPPSSYYDPVKVQPSYVSEKLQSLLDNVLDGDISETEDIFISEENHDWFSRATISQLGDFKSIYTIISDDDPYKAKFESPESFLGYYNDYVSFITSNGSPEQPINESDLFGYALVKCQGNYTEAAKEISLFYKFVSRYDLSSGIKSGLIQFPDMASDDYLGNQKIFYQTVFKKINLPVMLSITNETDVAPEMGEVTTLLKRLNPDLVDQNNAKQVWGYAIGSEDLNMADWAGFYYHSWSQRALVFDGVANPAAIAIDQSIREFPITFYDSWTEFSPTDGGSSKDALIAMSGMDNMEYRRLLKAGIIDINDTQNSGLPVIHTVTQYSNATISKEVVSITPEISAITLLDPSDDQKQTTYYGSPELIKLYAEKGYAPANFSSSEWFDKSESFASPELLHYFLSSDIRVPRDYYILSNYAEEDQRGVAQTLLEYKISVLETPYNLATYLKYDLDVPREDILKLINDVDPYYGYDSIVNALPYLAKMGLVKPDHPMVKASIEHFPQATFDYYASLTPDGQYLLKQEYPDLQLQIEYYVINTIDNARFDDKQVFSKEAINQFFPILLQSFRHKSKDSAVQQLNSMLPYLSVDQLNILLQDRHLNDKDFAELFDPGNMLVSDKYSDLHASLIRLESVVSTRPDLQLSLAPVFLKEKVWDSEMGTDKIDGLIAQALDNHQFSSINSQDIFYQLQEVGYVPSPEIADRLVEESMSEMQAYNTNYYYMSGVNVVLGHYANPDQFTTAMQYLIDQNDDESTGFAGQIFYERFGKYTYDDIPIPMNRQERTLLNNLMSNDSILLLLGEEGGFTSIYYGYADYLSETNVHRIYELSLPIMSQREQYNIIADMQKHDFHPPIFVFNHDKFIEEVFGEHTSERWSLLDSSSNDFVKNNLTFTEYLDILDYATEDKGILGMYMSEDIAKVINHDFLMTIPGYTPQQEQELVNKIIREFTTIDKESISLQTYFLVPYLLSQNPDFDYGPYLVALVDQSYGLSYGIEHNSETIRLFIEATKNIQAKYWDEIKANDPEKYDYLQQLIANYNLSNLPGKRR